MWATVLLQLSTSPHPRPSGVALGHRTRRLVLTLPKAIRLTDEFEQVRMMRQPIQEGAGQAFIRDAFMMPPF
jgi:hypothetical protein